MALKLDAIGTVGDPVERSWSSKDALLYALAVGAGADNPTKELAFTTESTKGVPQQVLPTFGVVAAMGAGKVVRGIGKFNPAMLVHAEQGIEIHRPIEPEGTVLITPVLSDIADKGSGALVVTEARAVDAETGEPAFTTRSGMFIRGEGGFDPDRGPSGPKPTMPDRAPDHVVAYPTLPHQALIYRLCGDRNPLHSDPSFAALGGFDRPILHGLCTYGFTGRALLHSLCGGEASRLTAVYGRFSKPVLPGETLTVSIWVDEDGKGASFRTTTDADTVVLDLGRCSFT